MDDFSKLIEQNVTDALTEKPIEFSIGKRAFTINPPTLGKMQVLSKYYLQLDIDEAALDKEPHLESMRLRESKTDVVCMLMAVAVCNSKADLLNDKRISELANFFKWNTNAKDFAVIILALLTQVDYVNFITSIRLTKTLRQNKPRT